MHQNVQRALLKLAVECRGTDPVLGTELRQQFEKGLLWLIAGEDEDLEEFVDAVEADSRKDGIRRLQWSRPDDDHGKLLEMLVRLGPAGLSDRLLCDALLCPSLPLIAEGVMLGVAQTRRPNRIWKQVEEEVAAAQDPIDDYLRTLTPEEQEEYFENR